MVAGAAGVVAAAVIAVTVVAAPPSARIVLRGGTAASGSTLDGFGDGFDPSGSNVQISLSGPSSTGGPTVWFGKPDHSGAFVFGFTVPSTAPGAYSVNAVQTSPEGGLQATAPLQITGVPPGSDDDNGQQGQGNHPQPSQPPHTVPNGPVATTASNASSPVTTAAAPATSGMAASADTPVFGVPLGGAVRLPNPPPQVATMWRVAGAVPSSSTTVAAIGAPVAAAPALSAGSSGAPSLVTLMALGVVIASAIVVIATTWQLRSPEAPAPAPVPERQTVLGRSATMRSSDLWSGSPARFR